MSNLKSLVNSFDQTYNKLFDAYQTFKSSANLTTEAINSSLNVKRQYHVLKVKDVTNAYTTICENDNKKKQKISHEAEEIVSRLQKEYEKVRKEVRRQSTEIRKVVDKNVQEAEMAHDKQVNEYNTISNELRGKIDVAKAKLDGLISKETELKSAGNYSKEEIEALGHTINIQENRITSLQNRLKNSEKTYQKAIMKVEQLEKQQLLEEKNNAEHNNNKNSSTINTTTTTTTTTTTNNNSNNNDELKKAKLEVIRWRTQANILQTIIKSKQEDADQHNELRKHLQETLIEIINVKDSRKNELVECNKDLTRLQMSMKPLFIYANNI